MMTEKETIVERIRKLLRLARNNSNEHEAGAALAMAQRLMLAHDITNVEEKVEEVAIRGDWNMYDVDKKWQQVLTSAVAKLYNCKSVQSTMTGRVRFYGKPSNVLVCADTLVWITEQVNALHKQGLVALKDQFCTTSLSKRQYRDFRLSFKEACALRIWHRVCEIVAVQRNEIPAHMALVVIDQALAAADDLLKQDGVKTGRAMDFRTGIGTGAGRAAGDQVKLQHGFKPQPKMITN